MDTAEPKVYDPRETLNSLGDNFDHLDIDFEELQLAVKNSDNTLRKNNILLKGLNVEGESASQYLEDI